MSRNGVMDNISAFVRIQGTVVFTLGQKRNLFFNEENLKFFDFPEL